MEQQLSHMTTPPTPTGPSTTPSLDEPENAHFTGVPSDKVPLLWDRVEGMIERALEKGGDGKYEAEDVLECLKARDMQLWLGYDDLGAALAVITEIRIFPRRRCLNIVLVSARDRKMANHWWRFLPMLDDYAQHEGCTSVEGAGRKAWARKKAPHGYDIVRTVWRKWV